MTSTENPKIILLAENDPALADRIKTRIQAETKLTVICAGDHAETLRLLSQYPQGIAVALAEYRLPGATDGDTVLEILSSNIPVVILKSIHDGGFRGRPASWLVVEHVLKEKPRAIEMAVAAVGRILRNRRTRVLVADSSPVAQETLSHLLAMHCYQVDSVSHVDQALEQLARHPDTRLAIVDINVAGLDGVSLVQKIRDSHPPDNMAVIGTSAIADNKIAARFIRNGANDFFIKKDFLPEEFFCRVNQCLDQLDRIASIRETAIRDHLTGLYNRRFFFDVGNKLFAHACRQNSPIACAVIDIDHFKQINDTFGHKAGDLVLRQVSGLFRARFRESDIVARIGGEEFCVLGLNMDEANAFRIFDQLRKTVAASQLDIGDSDPVRISISIGICALRLNSLEEMIQAADVNLYRAKSSGRNRVVIS
ncbi:MAG: diguanylate cyclase [Deltaproteobacteria bacterium]|nr:diguanylate cyclase [Deltaproteobacteria bacterium]